MVIPSMILKQLYTFGSLRNGESGIQFSLKNRLSDATVTQITGVRIGDVQIPAERMWLSTGNGRRSAQTVSAENPVNFPLRQHVDIFVDHAPLPLGKHGIEVFVSTDPFGAIAIEVEDEVNEEVEGPRIPRDLHDDYSEKAVQARQDFVKAFTGVELDHVTKHSFDPHLVQGNIENFTGVAQIPLGIAGPVQINGEHAQGEFLIPLAASEGTLVASYNRGIKVTNLSGGIKTTIVDDAMQRAPVFVFDDARGARDFVRWLQLNTESIREVSESTSNIAKFLYVDHYLAAKFAYLRFNFETGDAAGQNMVGKATYAACSWIIENYDGPHDIRHFYLESNFATDKKGSQINTLKTRGKRVVAEAVVKRDVLMQHMRVTPEQLNYHSQVANVGAFMSGVTNNGLHASNAITAMFIACGQDVANVSESSHGIVHSEVTHEGDLYLSVTLPSLIVATYGGGTRLATQNECLRMLGCSGAGKVHKFAEIVAGVVLAGEISLAAAISAADWVSSHEEFGRNR